VPEPKVSSGKPKK